MKSIIKNGLIAVVLLALCSAVNAQQNAETGFNMPALNPHSRLADLGGSHIGIRVPDYAAAIKWYTEKLDFRIIHEWDYADEKLAYLAPANTNDFWIEILAGGTLTTPKTRFDDLGKSLEVEGYHHICMHVTNLDRVIKELKSRGVIFIGQTFHLDAINRNLAFIQDPWGNMIELAEVVKN